jgi:hypothetical protein
MHLGKCRYLMDPSAEYNSMRLDYTIPSETLNILALKSLGASSGYLIELVD